MTQEELQARLGSKYALQKPLATGGMGEIYLARDTHLGREVVVKTIKPKYAGNEHMVERFKLEAKIAARVQSPCIVQVIELIENDDVLFLVQERVVGRTLREECDTRSANKACHSDKEVVEIMTQLADAMTAIHAEDYIHRDIKARNIVMRELSDGTSIATLIDFGVASDPDAELTQDGEIVGTYGHIPPEAHSGQLSNRIDLFAAGNVMYRVLTGEAPFKGKNLTELKEAVFNFDPPAPVSIRPDMHPALSAICMKMLEKDPNERLGTAGELKYALMDLDRAASVYSSTIERGKQSKGPDAETSLGSRPKKNAEQERPKSFEKKAAIPTPQPALEHIAARKRLSDDNLSAVLLEPPKPGHEKLKGLSADHKYPLGMAALIALAVIYLLSGRGPSTAPQASASFIASTATPLFAERDVFARGKAKEEPQTPSVEPARSPLPTQPKAKTTARRKNKKKSPAAAALKETEQDTQPEPEVINRDPAAFATGIVRFGTGSGASSNALGVMEFDSIAVELLTPVDTSAKKTVIVARATESFGLPGSNVIIPQGTLFYGRFTYVGSGENARLEINFHKMRLPSRKTIKIRAQATDRQNIAGIGLPSKKTDGALAANTASGAGAIIRDVVGGGYAGAVSDPHIQEAQRRAEAQRQKNVKSVLPQKTRFKIQFLEAV